MNHALVIDQEYLKAFDYFRSELKRRVGIAIADNKGEMLKGRLRKHVIELGLPDFDAYAAFLKKIPDNHAEWEIFINCLTTNKTDFFREPEHFEYLSREILREWQTETRSSSEFNIWCAASSTGEEPFTLSMVLLKHAKIQPFSYSILATDIDSEVLSRAKRGVYPISKLEEIPLEYRRDSIAVGTGDISSWFKIKDHLRAALSYQRCNLIHTPFQITKKFDVIFCRNVLIYFTPDTIAKVAEGLYGATKPGGYLVIGHSESLHNVKTQWQYVKPSVYRRRA